MNTKKTKSIAIVTGASSGLGRQYTYLLDKDKDYDFDELWLIARREQRLAALASELKTPAKIIPLDLAKDESISAFAENP